MYLTTATSLAPHNTIPSHPHPFLLPYLSLPHFSFLLSFFLSFPINHPSPLPFTPSLFFPSFLLPLPKLPYKPSFSPAYSNSLILLSFLSLIYYQLNPNIKCLPDAIRADIVAIFAPWIPPCPCPLDVEGIAEMISKMKRKAIDMLNIRKKEN